MALTFPSSLSSRTGRTLFFGFLLSAWEMAAGARGDAMPRDTVQQAWYQDGRNPVRAARDQGWTHGLQFSQRVEEAEAQGVESASVGGFDHQVSHQQVV